MNLNFMLVHRLYMADRFHLCDASRLAKARPGQGVNQQIPLQAKPPRMPKQRGWRMNTTSWEGDFSVNTKETILSLSLCVILKRQHERCGGNTSLIV